MQGSPAWEPGTGARHAVCEHREAMPAQGGSTRRTFKSIRPPPSLLLPLPRCERLLRADACMHGTDWGAVSRHGRAASGGCWGLPKVCAPLLAGHRKPQGRRSRCQHPGANMLLPVTHQMAAGKRQGPFPTGSGAVAAAAAPAAACSSLTLRRIHMAGRFLNSLV